MIRLLGPTILLALTHVYIGGENIGFSLKPDGIIVSGTYDVVGNRTVYNPKNSDIRIGDVISYLDDYKISAVEDVSNYLSTLTEGKVDLTIVRSGEKIQRELKLLKVGDRLKTGLYVKERLLGIGTVSYYDPSTKTYGALGHPVKDAGADVFELASGSIYSSTVNGVKPNGEGAVGEKVATLDQDTVLGNVTKNTDYGIVGSYVELPENAVLYEVAAPSAVKLGDAQIMTVLSGDKKEIFDIKITDLKKQSQVATKGITFKVTDPRLIAKTNGIVAGMSGSPIIQDGKLIGAVTHVLVNEPLKGYGIYMEHMINGLGD